jgi:hypothetical protein
MLFTWLDSMGDGDAQKNSTYSADAAARLNEIEIYLKQGELENAYNLALFTLTLPMSPQQEIQLYYRLSRSRERDWPHLAIQFLDAALERAQELADPAVFAVLAAKQAGLHYHLHSFFSAADYSADALDALHVLADAQVAVDPEFEMELLWGLATQQFYTAEYEQSFQLLERTRTLTKVVPMTAEAQRRAALIEWTAALVQRWRGRPKLALIHALDAQERYEALQVGSTAETARLRIVIADIILDTMKALPAGTVADKRIANVERHLLNAFAHAAAANDRAAGALAQLAYVRYSRLSGTSFNRMGAIEQADSIGRETADLLLQCQAQTALADELAFRHEDEPALNAYRRALDVIARSDALVMGHWAGHALQRFYREGAL